MLCAPYPAKQRKPEETRLGGTRLPSVWEPLGNTEAAREERSHNIFTEAFSVFGDWAF